MAMEDPFKDDPFFNPQAGDNTAQAQGQQEQPQQTQLRQTEPQAVQKYTEQPVKAPEEQISTSDIFTGVSWLLIAIPLVLTILIGLIFKAGYKEAKFVTSGKNTLKAVFEFAKYLIIPNDKGLKFVDKVIATPFMRLELFGLNSGFVKIGEIYNGYFEQKFRHKEHGVEQSINPFLGHVAFVISAFQTKQFILHAVRAMISLELFYFFATNLLILPFVWLIQHIGGTQGMISETQSNLMLVAMIVLSILSLIMAWSYIRKIVDDVLYIMQTQQDVDNKEFRNFIIDNLAIIGKHGKAIDSGLAREAESYTLATFFNERKGS